jgi:O-antigen/teichoic acid export membrane protein
VPFRKAVQILQSKNLSIMLIRALSIGLKTFFIFFSAKLLSLEDFGKLALINTAISLMLSVMSINFAQYTSRLLVEKSKVLNEIYHHFLFISFTGLISLLSFPLLIKYAGIDTEIIGKFLVILYLEHILNEIFRILIPLNRIVYANVIHFLKVCSSTLFPLLIILIFKKATLVLILNTWLVTLLLFLIVLAVAHLKLNHFRSFKFSSSFITAGLKTSTYYLAISILGRSLFTLDKFFVNHISGTSEVGIYTFYYSMAFTLQTLIETSFITPSMHEMLKSKNLKNTFYSLLFKVVSTGLVIGGGLILAKDQILTFLNKEAFLEDFQLLYIFLIAALLFSMASATMMPLYAKKKDREILISFMLSFIIFILLSLTHNTNFYSIALNMALSFLSLFFFLLIQFRRTI